MSPSWRMALIVLAGGVIAQAAPAESPPDRPALTVEDVLPGCRSLIATRGVPTSSEAGFCSGLVDGLLYLGTTIPEAFCFNVPSDVPHYRVVVEIVEEIEPIYSWVKQQHFRALAIEVLGHKWPCYSQPSAMTRQ